MKILLTALLLIIAHNSFADGLYTGAWSYHYYKDEVEEAGYDINSNQNLIAYEYKNVLVGYYKNSWGYDTAVIAYRFDIVTIGDFAGALYVGGNYGYRFCSNDKISDKKSKACGVAMPAIIYTKHTLQPALIGIDHGAAIALHWDI
jgi:hypothetical protein